MFETATETVEPSRVIRYRLLFGGQNVSYLRVVELWESSHEFQDFFTSLLAKSEFSGFRWEAPCLSTSLADRPFEFVLVNTPAFATRKTDRRSFADHFSTGDDKGVVSFQNLGGDATLVVPSPRTDADIYGHLAGFVRGAPESQQRSLWKVLGQSIRTNLTDSPIWISTAGGGVAWLHVRIDRSPKYYTYAPYRSSQSTQS